MSTLLVKKKLQILERNLPTKYGKVDFLARDGRDLVVVEVETKSSEHHGSIIEAMTPTKQAKLVLLAHQLQREYRTPNVRIDIVTINSDDSQSTACHHKGVIEANG